MSILPSRPGTLAGPLAISLALHIAALAWLHPRGTWHPVMPSFDLSVRLAPEEVAVLVPPAPAPRRASRSRAPKAGPVPPPPVEAAPAPEPLQPLRLRVVADPAEYGIAPSMPGRPYAWQGQLEELPFPPEGIVVRYPDEQLRDAQRGLVVVRVDIAPSGAIEDMELVCTSPPFDAVVLEALRATRFRPPLARQGAVPAWVLLEFAFLAQPQGEADPDRAEQSLVELQKNCPRRGE